MSWKAGLKHIKKGDDEELARHLAALRDAKENTISRIRHYKDVQLYEEEMRSREEYLEKHWQRDRHWDNEKEKKEKEILQKSSQSLLREVLSCNIAVEDLLSDQCEGTWKELTYIPATPSHGSGIIATGLAPFVYSPSSVKANQFLLQTLSATDPLLLDQIMEAKSGHHSLDLKSSSGLASYSVSETQPPVSSRAQLINRIQSTTSSVPGTPMAARSGPPTVSKRLIDSVFLCGPRRSDLLDLLSGEAPDLTPTSIYPVAVGRSDISSKKSSDSNAVGARPKSLRLSGDGVHTGGGSVLGYGLVPEIMYLTSQDPDIVTDILPSFCFPNGVETTVTDVFGGKAPANLLGTTMPGRVDGGQTYTETIKPKYFVFQLTGHDNVQYGVCMRFTRRFGDKTPFSPVVYTSYCICLVTANPLFLFLFDVLAAFLNAGGLDVSEPISGNDGGDMLVPPNLKYLDEFALKLLRQPVPGYGMQLAYTVSVKGNSQEVALQRRPRHEISMSTLDTFLNQSKDGSIGSTETNYHILEWSLPVLLAYVPLKEILFVLGCMLTEMKVIVKCKDIGVLSACVMGLLNLMRPLSWSCPYIIILPESLRDYLDSPVPLIVGVVTTPACESAEYLSPTPGVIVIDVNMRKVNLDPTDVVYSHTLKLPYTDTLLPKLKVHAEIIANLTKMKRRNKDTTASGPSDPITAAAIKRLNSGQFSQTSSPRTINRRATTGCSVPMLNFAAAGLGSTENSPRDGLLSSPGRRRSLSRLSSTEVNSPRDELKSSPRKYAQGVAAQTLMKKYSNDSIKPVPPSSPSGGSRSRANSFGGGKQSASTHPEPDSGSDFMKRSASAVSELSTEEEKNSPEILPVSVVDLATAVMNFSDTLAAHMTQITDTAIKLSWDNKAQRRQARHDLRNAPRERTSSDASINSSDVSLSVNEESLPTIHSNMTFRKVGNAMLSFIKKFKDTQIFCHYCQLERERQEALALMELADSISSTTPSAPTASPAVSYRTAGVDLPPILETVNNDFNSSSKSELSIVVPADGYSSHGPSTQYISPDKREPLKDPVAAMFSIILSGTVPLSALTLNMLSDSADMLYANSIVHEVDGKVVDGAATAAALLVSNESYRNNSNNHNAGNFTDAAPSGFEDSPHPSSWNPFASPPPGRHERTSSSPLDLTPKAVTSDTTKTARPNAATKDTLNPFSDINETILFCNGRCGGRVDTPLCTEICCQVWQDKAEEAQRMMEARSILLEMRSRNSSASTKVITKSGQVIKIPPIPTMKQIRETNSQFEMRLELIHKKGNQPTDNKVYRGGLPKDSPTKPGNRKPRSQAGGSGKNNISQSSKAIVNYYRGVEIRQQKRRRQAAADIICRHIYAMVQSNRLAQLMRAIVSVQAAVRGFFVRHNFELLEVLLIQRNFEYKVARRKFRKWLNRLAEMKHTQKFSPSPGKRPSVQSNSSAELDFSAHSPPVTPIPAASLSPVPTTSRFADLTSAVANALGGRGKSPRPDGNGLTVKTDAPLTAMDPFSPSSGSGTRRGGISSFNSSSTMTASTVGVDELSAFKVLREQPSSVSECSVPSSDGYQTAKDKFLRKNQLTLATQQLPDDQGFQGIHSTLLNKKNMTSTPHTTYSDTGRKSPSNMSQFSTASAVSVMDDVLKLKQKQRMSTGSIKNTPLSRSHTISAGEEKQLDPIPDILNKPVPSPKRGTEKHSFRGDENKQEQGVMAGKAIRRSSSFGCDAEDEKLPTDSDNVSYNYFEHVDLDDEIEELEADLNKDKWSSDAISGSGGSAFQARLVNKNTASPLTRHTNKQTPKGLSATNNMSSIPETDHESESNQTPRDTSMTPVTSPKRGFSGEGGGQAAAADPKDGFREGSPVKRVSSQMKSLQDTLEEVLKSELDGRKQHEDSTPSYAAARMTNTVSPKILPYQGRKSARKRNVPPNQINIESLASITEADAGLESMGGRNSEPPSIVKSKSPAPGHNRHSSDASVLSDDDSGSYPGGYSSPLLPAVAQAMGAAFVKELLTIQQQRSIGALHDLLRRGVNVMKHGRSGRPKLRRLFCDESLSTLFWRELDAHHLKSVEVNVGSSSHNDSAEAVELSAADEEVRGTQKRRRSSFLRFHKDDVDRQVLVSDILEVTDDLSAEVMQRSISRQPYSLGAHQDVATCVISLVLKNKSRTYDFEIDEKSWNVLFHSLRILVNYYQVDLPGAANEC